MAGADWTTISIWGWTLIAVTVILAAALLALIVMAIRYLLARMEREATERTVSASKAHTSPSAAARSDGRQVTHNPSPVPPEDPHAPPSPQSGLTRPGY